MAVFPLVSAFQAQNVMNPELLWSLGRVGGIGITEDGKSVVYNVRTYDIGENKGSSKQYIIPIEGGEAKEVSDVSSLVKNKNVSPDGKSTILSKEVKLTKVNGVDYYPEMTQSEVMVYDDLHYRHWDHWEDGAYGHVFIKSESGEVDLMINEPYDCPQKPFGGDEDYIWNNDGSKVLYVTKKKVGKEYVISTNTDIFEYDVATKKTVNLTEGYMGYDMAPSYSKDGVFAWLSMATAGCESDKNDIIVRKDGKDDNLTIDWDGTVNGYVWDEGGKMIYFTAPVGGTVQLFKISNLFHKKKPVQIEQVTKGQHDVRGILGQSGDLLVVSRCDMNHAAELYTVNLEDGIMKQLTHVNDEAYSKIKMGKIEKKYIKTTDDQDMLTWVIYPPDFDPNKKYPTLLYCQGGPQSALSQFYSFRWNFQLMAANGYIIVAPNRRGMPGHGVKWNADISKNYGDQPMKDYLSAIDELAKESYVDNDRLGCIGASFGGYSVFQLAGTHNKRFKSFISHDGIFNWYSMYGTTEEMWFVNWDLGGAYWDKENSDAKRAYNEYNPMNHVDKWDTPIMIIQGGKDYRVPIGQGLEAFQAAQLRGIRSRLLYFPNENHWVLKAQNGIVWQKEFYRWLKETL